MRKIIIYAIFAGLLSLQFGCSQSDKPNNNANLATATPTPSPTNSNEANSAVQKTDEPVPTFQDAQSALTAGNKYFDDDKTEKAIEAYKQAVTLDPDLAEAHFKLGVCYALLEDEKESVAQEASPEETPKPKGKAAATKVAKKDSEKEFEAAVKAYQKLLAKNPKDDMAQFNLARCYNKLNMDKEAEKAARQAVRLKPDESSYHTELGAILIKLAKYGEALGVLKKAQSLDPANSRPEELIEQAQAGQKRINYGRPKDGGKSDKPGTKSDAPQKTGTESKNDNR